MPVESASLQNNESTVVSQGFHASPTSGKPASLVVFSDDWGRHPSSCQHLIKQLLPNYEVLWVNTIGTRTPQLDWATINRIGEKLGQWFKRPNKNAGEGASPEVQGHENLRVVNPRMWPWFSKSIDRRFNRWLLTKQLNPLIETLPQPVTAITTLPITADLPGRLSVDNWLYYCVDDFGEWPGLDGSTLRRMDEVMINRADSIVAVSEHLRRMISSCGRDSRLLTHGVDLDHWQNSVKNDEESKTSTPTAVFWGVVDRRLDTQMLTALSQRIDDGQIVLIGPQQDPDPAVLSLPNVLAIGPRPFAELPSIARTADVLIMPYADLPVTRAMQPLKMKEYIATGRPVVVSDLPAVRNWSDCMDVSSTPEQFADAVMLRIAGGVTFQQREARQRLQSEGWSAKATELESALQRNGEQ